MTPWPASTTDARQGRETRRSGRARDHSPCVPHTSGVYSSDSEASRGDPTEGPRTCPRAHGRQSPQDEVRKCPAREGNPRIDPATSPSTTITLLITTSSALSRDQRRSNAHPVREVEWPNARRRQGRRDPL